MEPVAAPPAGLPKKVKAKAKAKAKPKAPAAAVPKSAGSASDAASTTAPNKEGTARVVEAIQRDGRLRVAVQRHTYALQCKLLETVDVDYLTWSLQYLTPENYSDATIERGLEGHCGFPTCASALAKKPNSARFHISTKDQQVYELHDRAYFCSDKCAVASQWVKEQLSEDAVHLRTHVLAEYDEKTGRILPKHRGPTKEKTGPFGALAIHEHVAPPPPSTEFDGTFAIEGYTPALEMSNAPPPTAKPAVTIPITAPPKEKATATRPPAPEPEPEPEAPKKPFEKLTKSKVLLQLNMFGELWTVLARWCTARTIAFLFPDFDPWKDHEAKKNAANVAVKTEKSGDAKTEKIDGEDDRGPVLLRPAVDSEEPEIVRARLAMDNFARYLPLLYKELGIDFMVEQEMRDLCSTFDFFHPVDLSRPPHCVSYALVLLEALTARHETLAKVMHRANSARLKALVQQYGLTHDEFNGLVAVFRPPSGFTPPLALPPLKTQP